MQPQQPRDLLPPLPESPPGADDPRLPDLAARIEDALLASQPGTVSLLNQRGRDALPAYAMMKARQALLHLDSLVSQGNQSPDVAESEAMREIGLS